MPTKILAIDDSKTMRLAIKITFAAEDAKVTAVSKGSEAVARARQMQADVILVDHKLGDGEPSGIEVVAALKQNPATANIPVILLVPAKGGVSESEIFAAGADSYIGKPFDSQELIDKVAASLGRGAGKPVPKPAAPTATAPVAAPQKPPAAAPPATVKPSVAAKPPIAAPPAAAATPVAPAAAAARKPGPTPATPVAPAAKPPAATAAPAAAAKPPAAATPAAAAKPPAATPARAPAATPAPTATPVAAKPGPTPARAPASTPAITPAATPVAAAATPAATARPAAAAAAAPGQIPIAVPIPFTAASSPTPGMLERIKAAAGTNGAAVGLDPRAIQALLQLSHEVVEQIVWEVVPDLAEEIIKQKVR